MDTFYHSVTFKDASQDSIASALQEVGLRAYLTPEIDGAVVAFCPMEEFDRHVQSMPSVSKHCGCRAAMDVAVFDDDVLLLFVYANGRRLLYIGVPENVVHEPIESGESAPDSLDGNCVPIICNLFSPSASPESVLGILEDDYICQSDRHADLLGLLGLPDAAICGYELIEEGSLPADLTLKDLRHVS